MFDVRQQAQGSGLSGSSGEPVATLEVRRILMRLAADQERAAADAAAQVPYWKSCPDTVIGYRAAAKALRAIAETLPTVAA